MRNKRILAAVFAAAVVMSLTACNNTKVETPAEVTTTTTVADAPASDTTTEPAETDAPETDEPETDTTNDEAAILAAAELLLDEDCEITSVMFKAGYTADYDNATKIGEFEYAPFTWDYSFATVDELKAYLHSIYSAEYYANFGFDSMLSGGAAMYIDYEGQILMNISGGGGGGNIWEYGTMTIDSVDGDVYTLSVEGQTSYEDPVSLVFTMINEDSLFKINTMEIAYSD